MQWEDGTLLTGQAPRLSVVIPTFNSAPYLPSTLDACREALDLCGWPAEIVLVDDGSTDGGADVARSWADERQTPVNVISTVNQGRFLARWTGLQAAQGEFVLLLDSRVLLYPTSLQHVCQAIEAGSSDVPRVWNAHAVTDASAPLVGLFWEVPVHVFWGAYLADPKPVSYGLSDFNRFPKGTTAFLATRSLLVQACEAVWPTADAALMSDDTKLIRHVAGKTPIRIDPAFRVLYRPRTDVLAFVRHSLGRGTMLVDSFGGTSRACTAMLLALASAPVIGLVLLALGIAARSWGTLAVVLTSAVLAVLVPATIAAVRRCPPRAVLAFVTYLPLFAIPYWLGLVRGLVVHRSVLRPVSTPSG